MKKLLLLLVSVVSCAFASWAEESWSYEVSSGAYETEVANFGKAFDLTVDDPAKTPYTGVNWSKKTGVVWNGLQFGKSNQPVNSVTLTSNSSAPFQDKAIKSVYAKISGACTITVSVDGEAYSTFVNDASATSAVNSGTNVEYVFTGNDIVGEVKITLTHTSSDTKAIYLRKIEVVYEEANLDKSKPATKIDFSIEEGEYKEDQILVLSTDGRDVDGNMLPIHYLISENEEANADSPLYTEPIKVDKDMVVSAWVNDDVTGSCTYIIDKTPYAPIASYDGKEIESGEFNAYYGEEIVFSAKNATSLLIESSAWDDIKKVDGNTYTVNATDDMYTIVASNEYGNTKEVDYNININNPEAPIVKIGDETFTDDIESMTLPVGTVVSVALPRGATEIVVTDIDENVVALTDGSFTLTEKGEHIFTVTAKTPLEKIESAILLNFDVVTTQYKTATFDFTTNSYGMTAVSGNAEYEKKLHISQDGVTLSFEGGSSHRYWTTTKNGITTYSLRTYTANPDMTFIVPANCKITKITFVEVSGETVSIKEKLSGEQLGAIEKNKVWTVKDNVTTSEVVLSTASNSRINSITIEYTSYEADEPVAPEVTLNEDVTDYSNAKFTVTADKGHHIHYTFKHNVPNTPAQTMALAEEQNDWNVKVEHYNHEFKAADHIEALNPGETVRFTFAAYNPDTKQLIISRL